ncbi:hypothetical protein E5D57_011891 [Metarhizium anisopliae]|nr:hypothetical protein E5D57_011891 [Metarhizium anisopliae]
MPTETNSLSRSDTNLRASPHAAVSPMSQPAPRPPVQDGRLPPRRTAVGLISGGSLFPALNM